MLRTVTCFDRPGKPKVFFANQNLIHSKLILRSESFAIHFFTISFKLFLHCLAMKYPQQGMVLRPDSYCQQDTELLTIVVHKMVVFLSVPNAVR